mmetsp:Transcript_49464/g.108026  ORF Transcript_49464/g.108026 Transcript_49464/m.108026 type:complete len:222 (-) Transcript_49464:559-1224(-)
MLNQHTGREARRHRPSANQANTKDHAQVSLGRGRQGDSGQYRGNQRLQRLHRKLQSHILVPDGLHSEALGVVEEESQREHAPPHVPKQGPHVITAPDEQPHESRSHKERRRCHQHAGPQKGAIGHHLVSHEALYLAQRSEGLSGIDRSEVEPDHHEGHHNPKGPTLYVLTAPVSGAEHPQNTQNGQRQMHGGIGHDGVHVHSVPKSVDHRGAERKVPCRTC